MKHLLFAGLSLVALSCANAVSETDTRSGSILFLGRIVDPAK